MSMVLICCGKRHVGLFEGGVSEFQLWGLRKIFKTTLRRTLGSVLSKLGGWNL